MSRMSEWVLIVVLLIVAVLFAMRDAHAWTYGNGSLYLGSPRYDIIQQCEPGIANPNRNHGCTFNMCVINLF